MPLGRAAATAGRRWTVDRLLDHPIYSDREQRTWIEASRNGESESIRRQAYEALIINNLRLVHRIVTSLRYQDEDRDDVFQNGVLGLISGIKNFDPQHSTPVYTYLGLWIRESIIRQRANTQRRIYVPPAVQQLWAQVRREIAQQQQSGTEITPASITASMHAKLSPTERRARHLSTMDESVAAFIMNGEDQDAVELEPRLTDPVTGKERGFLPDRASLSVEYEVMVRQQLEFHLQCVRTLSSHLVVLPERRRRAFILRYGLDGFGYTRSYIDVGRDPALRVTKTGAAQMIEAGWKQLHSLDLLPGWNNAWLLETLLVIEHLGALIGAQPLILQPGA